MLITPRRVICSRHILSIVSLKARTNFSRSCSCGSLPFSGVITEVGISVNGYLEESTGTAREEVLVDFLKGDTRVEIDIMLLLLRLFKDELAHKLPEQLAHGVHALLACCHVIDGMAHGEEHCLHSSSVRTVVHLDIALAYVADSMKALSDFGYNYTLYKTAFPWESEFEEVYGSEEELKNPVSYTFDIGDSKWKLDIMPYETQSERIYLYVAGIGGIIIVLLLTGFTCALLVLDEHRKKFKKLAITDALTGINNRHGYDERVTRYLKQNPDNHCVGVEFDIDDFKTINDMYGHVYGDVALKVLSEGMQKFFDKNVLLGRNGGDEFCIFLPDCTCADVKEKLEEFTKLKRSFKYEGEEHQFTISVGYAEYPVHADKPSKLMRCADTALYEVKLRGKNGCMAYKNGLRMEIRTQLGFALKDVSENLPGAFIIYKADKNDDEILFANREFIRFAGCKNMDELLVYTKRSFRNIIRVDEREAVIADIWKQIDEGHTNGYTHFYMQKADGGHIQVFDHGRIVENGRYGRVIYALITNLETVRENYGNSECNN